MLSIPPSHRSSVILCSRRFYWGCKTNKGGSKSDANNWHKLWLYIKCRTVSFWLSQNVAERKAPVLFLYNNWSNVSDFPLTFFNMQRWSLLQVIIHFSLWKGLISFPCLQLEMNLSLRLSTGNSSTSKNLLLIILWSQKLLKLCEKNTYSSLSACIFLFFLFLTWPAFILIFKPLKGLNGIISQNCYKDICLRT